MNVGALLTLDSGGAVLVTHDAEPTRRRRRFTFGRHVFLGCHQLEAARLLDQHLAVLIEMLDRRQIGVIEVRPGGGGGFWLDHLGARVRSPAGSVRRKTRAVRGAGECVGAVTASAVPSSAEEGGARKLLTLARQSPT